MKKILFLFLAIQLSLSFSQIGETKSKILKNIKPDFKIELNTEKKLVTNNKALLDGQKNIYEFNDNNVCEYYEMIVYGDATIIHEYFNQFNQKFRNFIYNDLLEDYEDITPQQDFCKNMEEACIISEHHVYKKITLKNGLILLLETSNEGNDYFIKFTTYTK